MFSKADANFVFVGNTGLEGTNYCVPGNSNPTLPISTSEYLT
jgi:hypothetical protein